ncbi:MAG: hypothetical protein Q7U31_02495, partial [Anaerolineaceae bacterium]|nr:hypothetical protein [Anaerolineaceae bacterium]
CREPSPAPERWLLIMLNTADSMELFAPLHPPPLSPPDSPPPSPPSNEDVVLVGLGAAFVKVLVGRGVSVWVAVGVSVAVAVAVSVTVGVDVLVVVAVFVAVFVAVLVKVGVTDAMIWLIVLVNAHAEPNPTNRTNTTTAKNRFINK